LSDDQRDHVPRGQEKLVEGKLTTFALFALGLCDFLLLIVQRLREFAYWLISESASKEAVS
jgi:hypothetical protein